MALFGQPADDEVGLGVISRLWIDKMNQFRCRGGKGTSWAGWSSFVHVIVANPANHVTPRGGKKCCQVSTRHGLMECVDIKGWENS